MAGDVVVIDCTAKFNDQISPSMERATQSADKFDKSIDRTKKQIDGLSGKKVDVEVGLKDRATAAIKSIWGGIKGFAGKSFRSTVSIVDKATAPLRFIKNSLFSIKTLVAGVMAGFAGQKLISGPIALADQIETAQIGFETMMGSAEKATQMMDRIKDFAAKTPFDTSGVISSVQQMMRAGWTVDNVMQDMEKIGNAAAAAGQGTEGVQGIVLALQQMRMAGKLNSQDMMQLTNRGVKSWEYVAQAIGKSIPETRQLAQKGLIPVDKAIQGIIDGMGEYDGMMDKMSNRTVSGLMSNIQDTFDIKIVEKWGKGLAAGATEGLGSFADWLDTLDPMLQRAGTSLYSLGEYLSKRFFGIVGNAQERISEVLQSDDFLDAPTLVGKIKVLWDKVIAEPFSAWWEDTMKPKIAEKAESVGENLGNGLSNGIKFLLGLDPSDSIEEGASIGASFAKGFMEGFDGDTIKKRLKEVFSDVFKSAFKVLPKGDSPNATSWVSALALTWLGGKVLSPFAALGKGINGGVKAFTGKGIGGHIMGGASVENPNLTHLTYSGTGLTGLAGKAGLAFGSQAGTSAGLVAAGTGAIAGGLVGGATLYSGVKDLYRGYKAEDENERKANYARGGFKVGGVASGAALGAMAGSIIPVIGTGVGALIGAGLGGLAGWLGGNQTAKQFEKQKYATEEMKKAVEDTTKSAEDMEAAFQKACSKDLRDHFGDMTLSLEEMQKYAQKITFGDDIESYTKFSESINQAKNALSNMQSSESSLEKWNWKAGLGIKLEEGDQEALMVSVDDYVNNAKSYIESKQYEFSCSVDILLDPESDFSERLKKQSNDYYGKLQTQLDSLHEELTASYKVALENDGIVDADEAKTISDIQQKIADITNKVSQAEYEAKLETLKIKFSGAGLTADNYGEFQKQIQVAAQEKADKAETALTSSISSLKLKLKDGAIEQEEYNAQVLELTKGYTAEIEKLNVDVTGFELNTITETYGKSLDGILPKIEGDTATKLNTAIKNAVASGELGKDPMQWDSDKVQKWFGLSSLEEETKTNMTTMIKNVAAGIPEQVAATMKEDENINIFKDLIKVDEKTMTATTDEAAKAAASSMKTSVSTYLTGETSGLAESSYPAVKQIANGMKPKGGEFDETAGAVKTEAKTALDTTFADGLKKDVPVSLTLKPTITNPTINIGGAGSGSATFTVDAPKRANGGMIRGGRQLSWLDEEGMGEVVIPFNPARRGRALDLWMQTGQKLGVMKHANGGMVGKALSGSKLKTAASQTKESKSGKEGITVQIAGITLELKTSGNQQNIMDMLKAQKDEISNFLSEVIADAVEDGFTNMPLATTKS